MKQFISAISSGWNPMRWLRLGLGAFVTIESVKGGDSFLAILGAVFMMQAVFNVGCCGTSCVAPGKMEKSESNDEINFEEVK